MTGYINSLIAVTVMCELAVCLVPDGGAQKKYVKVTCALAVLVTMITPVKELITHRADIADKLTDFFSAGREESSTSDSLCSAAAVLISYVENNFSDAGDDISVTFVTDENGTVTEVQIFISGAEDETCDSAETALRRELGTEVHVFGGGEYGKEQH